jgi:hypothetical protein
MKKLLIVVSLLALTACSTTKLTADAPSSDAVKYTQDFGKVEVTFNDETWTEIKSTGTASVPITDDAGLEQAMNIATMRAKRNIVEFINTDLKSGKTVDTITDSLAKEVAEDEQKSKQKAASIATKVSEKIAVEANGILKGVYVTDRKVSSDSRTVSVTVKVDKRSMNAAKQIRVAMGQ